MNYSGEGKRVNKQHIKNFCAVVDVHITNYFFYSSSHQQQNKSLTYDTRTCVKQNVRLVIICSLTRLLQIMHNIIFISTIHKEIGKCNPEELYKIIKKLNPEVVFLEAVDETYSTYENYLFSTYGVYHKKLEISALQKYNFDTSFEYVPVCENGLSDAFQRKNKIVCQNRDLQKLIDNFISLAEKHGFEFLNSSESMDLQEEMRLLESRVLNDDSLDKIVKADIDNYENPMIRNIYSYCKDNHFSSAIFMCGAAHRKSIIKKTHEYENKEGFKLNWSLYK